MMSIKNGGPPKKLVEKTLKYDNCQNCLTILIIDDKSPVFVPCGHICICVQCYEQGIIKCPICH